MRILFASTDATQTTGYGRIAYNILLHWSNLGHEIHHFAFQRYKLYGIEEDRKLPVNVHLIDVHTLSKDTFGTDIWADTVRKVDPDIIIVYNDMPVTCALLNQMLDSPKTCPFISYLDIVYTFQKSELVDHIAKYADHIFVFSDFWKKHLTDCFKISPKKVSVFPHGVDKNKFTKISKGSAKKVLGLKEDDFMIFNTNRNSYRKLLDITIKAFVRFWKLAGDNKKVKLMINCRVDIDTGYNFQDIIKTACILESVDYDIISTQNIKLLSENGGLVSDKLINTALNASDIGMNTCGGEGFGLCNTEGAYLGVPQIVTNTGGLSDIFRGFENMLVDPKVYMTLPANIDFHNGELAICDYKDFADKLLFYYNNRDILKADGASIEKHITQKYDWDNLLEEFSYSVDKLITRRNVQCLYINKDKDITARKSMEQQLVPGMDILRIRGGYDDFSSHTKAWRKAFDENNAITLVSRDNVVFKGDFTLKMLDAVSKLPMTWQIAHVNTESSGEEGHLANSSWYAISHSGLFAMHKSNYTIHVKDMVCFSVIV